LYMKKKKQSKAKKIPLAGEIEAWAEKGLKG
jgi:hypothetical protein